MRAVKKAIKQMTPTEVRENDQKGEPRETKYIFLTCEQLVLQADLQVPVTISLGIHLGTSLRSLMGVRTPSMLPNMEERPKLKSMTKNNMAHTCEPGISITASVNTIKARPVPEALCGRKMEKKIMRNLKLVRT